MVAAQELHQAGDDVQLIFDGGGTVWPGKLAQPDHVAHQLWESVHDVVAGACDYCAEAFDVTDQVRQAGVTLLDDYKRHPSIRTLLHDGYELLTF